MVCINNFSTVVYYYRTIISPLTPVPAAVTQKQQTRQGSQSNSVSKDRRSLELVQRLFEFSVMIFFLLQALPGIPIAPCHRTHPPRLEFVFWFVDFVPSLFVEISRYDGMSDRFRDCSALGNRVWYTI
jgi:hypothetical protein